MLNPTIRKLLDWGVGVVLILVGVLGFVVPLLPGWIFVVAGLAVLSSHSPWARAILGRFHQVGRWIRRTISRRAAAPDRDE